MGTNFEKKIEPEELFEKQDFFKQGFEEMSDILEDMKTKKKDAEKAKDAEEKLKAEEAKKKQEDSQPVENDALKQKVLTEAQLVKVKSLTDENAAVLAAKRKKAKLMTRTFAALLSEEKKSTAALLCEVQGTPAGEFVPSLDRSSRQQHKCRGWWHDNKKNCESTTAPHLRCGPWKREIAEKNIDATLLCHSSNGKPTLPAGNICFHFLGWKQLAAQIENLYADRAGDKVEKVNHVRRDLNLTYSLQCLLDRRAACQAGHIKQTEQLLVVAGHSLDVPNPMPLRDRSPWYQGNNYGDTIAWVTLKPWASSWQEKWQDKKKMLAKRREDIGGRTEGLAVKEPKQHNKPRQNEDLEPISFFSMPMEVYKCMMHEHHIECSVDFDPGDMELELAHMLMKKHVTAVCWSQDHADFGYEYLERRVFESMLVSENELVYDPALASLLNGDAKGTGPIGPRKRKKRGQEDPSTPAKGEGNKEGEGAKEKDSEEKPKKKPTYKKEGNLATKNELLDMVASLRNIDKSGKGGQDSIVIDEGGEGGEDLDDEDDEKSDDEELQSADDPF